MLGKYTETRFCVLRGMKQDAQNRKNTYKMTVTAAPAMDKPQHSGCH